MPLRHGCLLLLGCLTAAAWLLPGGEPVRAGKPEALARTDIHGDPLPGGARARLGTIRYQTDGFAVALAVSPDNRSIACLGHRSTITLLDMRTGKQLHHFPGDVSVGGRPVFSPDGRRLATGVKGGIVVWDVRTGQVAMKLRTDHDPFRLAFARDGRAITTAFEDGKVRQWDLATGKELWRFGVQSVAAVSVALSPDGRLLACGSADGTLQLWNLDACKVVWVVGQAEQDPFGRPVGAVPVLFSPDDRVLATNEYRRARAVICLRDVASGKELCCLGGDCEGLTCLAFSPSGKLVATSESSGWAVRLSEVATGKQVRRIWYWHGSGHAAFSPDGKTLVSSYGTTVRLWDIATGRRIRRNGGHATAVSSLAFSPDGKLLASSSQYDDDREVRLWDVRSSKELPPLGEVPGETHTVAFSPDGKTLASARWATVSVWDAASRKRLRTFGEGQHWRTPLAFTPDGQTILAGYMGNLRRWDVKTGKPSGIVEESSVSRQTAFSADGKYLASFTPLGQHIYVADRSTGKTLQRISPPLFPGGIVGETIIAFSPTRPLLASVSRKGLHLWDVTSGKHLRWTVLPEDWDVYSLAFSPDGRNLALAGGEGIIRLLEVASGKQRCVFQAHETSIGSLAFSPDGRLLASGSWDTTILLWDLARLPPGSKR